MNQLGKLDQQQQLEIVDVSDTTIGTAYHRLDPSKGDGFREWVKKGATLPHLFRGHHVPN